MVNASITNVMNRMNSFSIIIEMLNHIKVALITKWLVTGQQVCGG